MNMLSMGIFGVIGVVLWKIVKIIWGIFAKIIVWAGLWIPVLYTAVFFIMYVIKQAAWASVSTWFYVGLALSLVLGVLWFLRFTLGIGRKKTKKEIKDNKENEVK